jgi:hypothetical protein
VTNAEEDAKQQARLERRLDTATGRDPLGCFIVGCLPFWCFAFLLPLPLLLMLY